MLAPLAALASLAICAGLYAALYRDVMAYTAPPSNDP